MAWDEFCVLLAGIMPETPLGQLVSIRSETDNNIIKNFSTQQRKIYSDWRTYQAKIQSNNPEDLNKKEQALYNGIKNMFGRKGCGSNV